MKRESAIARSGKVISRIVVALAVGVAAASAALAQQSETMSGQPQQVVPQVGEMGAPAPQTHGGTPVVTSGGVPASAPAGSGTTAWRFECGFGR
jgi:uridine phosphorylase